MREKSTSVSKRLFTLIVQDCTEIVKIYSPQIEGNKDCEVLVCVDFYQYRIDLSPQTTCNMNTILKGEFPLEQ